MKKILLMLLGALIVLYFATRMFEHGGSTGIEKQRVMLAKNTAGKGFGPQSPRDIDLVDGTNPILFSTAPESSKMNLCNIHFHKNAEHKGGEFTTFAGDGDGHGYNSGYKYSGKFTQNELFQQMIKSVLVNIANF